MELLVSQIGQASLNYKIYVILIWETLDLYLELLVLEKFTVLLHDGAQHQATQQSDRREHPSMTYTKFLFR